MKNNALKSNMLFVAVLIFSLFTSLISNAQAWRNNLPQEKIDNGRLTLFDYQKAFNDYWEPYNLERGYYYENGEKVKAGGWKQFKRWEWYWESRVDANTGAFPTTTAWQEFQEYLDENPGSRSPSGNWTSLGPNTTSGGYAGLGRLNCVAFRPTDNNTLYVGAASGGVWKTTDGGSNWTPLGDGNAALGVSDIVVIKTNFDDIVYLATGDRDHSDTYSVGVLKSIDGGLTWNTTGLNWTQNQYRLVNRLLLDPLNNNVLYAATSNGVYKTTDAGVSWTQMTGIDFIDIEFQPGNSSTIYGSTTSGTIYRSTNSGSSWNQEYSISGGNRTQLAVSPDNSSYVYAVSANSSSGLNGIYKSTDSGENWSLAYNGVNMLGWQCDGSGSGGQGWYDLCIASDPNDADIVFVGGVNTWKSSNGGSTWSINNHWSGTCGGSATNVHADKHFFAYQPGTSTLYECNDGGLYKTSNASNTWTHLGSGLVTSQIYRIGVAQTVDDEVIIGLQDNGTKAMVNGSWYGEYVLGGDGMDCLIDYTNENTQYGELYYGDIYRTTNHWASSSYIASGISGSAAWVTPYTLDPSDHNTIYVGFQDVWKRTFPGSTWTKLSNWGGSTLKSIAVAPSDNAYIYTATYDNIYRTANSGANWSSINSNLPSSNSITFISVKNDDPTTAWVSFSGFSNNNRVYQTTNGGSSWTNISTGLPQLPVNCIIQNHQNTTEIELYAGTDVGIYVKVGNANWVPFFDGLPNVVVTELEIYYDANPANSLIRAATFGRGVWESDLYTGIAAPVADFSGTPLSGSAPLSVTFTDASSGNITSYAWTFGDGGTSTLQNPNYVYNTPGTYDVSLTVTGPGGSDINTKTSYITITTAAPVADFSGTPLSGSAPLSVTFTDASSGNITSYAWTFGDGGTSTLQNPNYVYNTPGTYDVSLTVTGPGGSDINTKTSYITITTAAPVADFSGTPLSGSAPLSVTFTDASSGNITSYAWTFGDGGTSTLQNPNYVYNTPGTYDVSLTVTGPGGSDINTKTSYITITTAAPVADFSGTPLSGSAPLSVTFTDASSGNITSYAWTFGDGGTSTLQNPNYVYNTPGTYDVSLTVTGPGGSDINTKTSYITITTAAPVADFIADDVTPIIGQTVTFTDLSTNTPTSWAWVFTPNTVTYVGGTSASHQNPQVQFNAAGSYDVSLTATNAGGLDIETKVNYINATIPPPVADFLADNTTPDVGEIVSFTDLSTNEPTSWNWVVTPSNFIFVNATNQNFQHPQVQFTTNGLYTVELTVTNDGGSDTETKTAYVNAGDVFEVIATATPNVICLGQSSLLQSFPSGGSGNYTFYWTSDPPGFFSNDQSVMVYPEENTLYNIEVDDGIQNISADVFVTVNPIPIITLGEWPEQLCNQNESPIQLTALPVGGVYSGDAVSSIGIFSPETAPLGWNVITYTYTDDLGCFNSARDSIYMDECVGIYELSIDNAQVSLYPNPNSGKFIIASSHNITRIEIVNQMGKLLSSEKYEAKSVRFNIILPKGLYFVRTFVTDKNNKIGLINKELMIQ